MISVYAPGGELAGRMDILRDPHHWVPGCTAEDESGNTWLAVGGNPRDGARSWKQTSFAVAAKTMPSAK